MSLSPKQENQFREIIESIRTSQIYGPSDDPDAQTAMIINYQDLLIRLKYYAKNLDDYELKNEILKLDENPETVYDVYELRSHLMPLIEDLEEELPSTVEQKENVVRIKSILKPIERFNLLEKIGSKLQNTMTTKDINLYIANFCIDFEPEEVASSKRQYVKDILSKEPTRVILRIARDLDLYSYESIVEVLELKNIDSTYINEQIKKCKSKIANGDFDGAITNARTLIESICMHILDEENIEYKKDGSLIKLYKLVSEKLKMQPGMYESEALKQITSGFITIVNGLSSLRNEMSDAHGKGKKKSYAPHERHARLAVNAAQTISEYLLTSKANNKQR